MNVTYHMSTAVCLDGKTYEYGTSGIGGTLSERGGVMPKFARQMIHEGADPATVVVVWRGTTRVYAVDRSLDWWAGKSFSEDAAGLRIRNYRKFRTTPSGTALRAGLTADLAATGDSHDVMQPRLQPGVKTGLKP